MARQIFFKPNSSIDDCARVLIKANQKGEKAWGVYNGHVLTSQDASFDSIYLEAFGQTKKEYDSIKRKDNVRFDYQDLIDRENEKSIAEVLAKARIDGEPKVDFVSVIKGLKFIVENIDLSYIEMATGLISLGCKFSIKDIKNAMGEKHINLSEGMRKGDIYSGAVIIANIRDSIHIKSRVIEAFLKEDNDSSIYHFIRLITGDDSYTKENILKKQRNLDEGRSV